MQLLLQLLAGGGYLLNKVFLAVFEHAKNNQPTQARRWRIAAWAVYLVGLPPWVIIFIQQRNWIAAMLESSGAPAMVLGLLNALGDSVQSPRWLNHLAMVCIPLGFGVSLYDFGGLTALSQWLEIGLVSGFLMGTYLLAKERPAGYGWYVLMHLACGALMWLQHYPWLFAQQLASLVFILDAWRASHPHHPSTENGA